MATTLSAHQLQQIEHALAEIGDYGEVRLIIEKGQLKFIQQLSSVAVVAPAPRPAPTATFQPLRERRT